MSSICIPFFSIYDYQEKGFGKLFIDELAQMAALVNYDQSVDSMNAFPGKHIFLF